MESFVVCKKGYTFPGEEGPSFTRGKIYSVKASQSHPVNGFAIVNDLGQIHWIREPGHPHFDDYFEFLKQP